MSRKMSGAKSILLLFAVLGLTGCFKESSKGRKDVDPSYKIALEQVRFERRGIFPFQFLQGKAIVLSDRPVIANHTWYPDPSATAIRIFEDGVERRVLQIHPFSEEEEKANVMVAVMVTRGLAVGPGGGTAFEPRLKELLKTLADGYINNLYNLAVVFCWGSAERRYPFLSAEVAEEYKTAFDNLTFPGPSEGNYQSCLEANLADLDWLQRATPEDAEKATLQKGTLPLFCDGSQNQRTQVLLLTDGLPFREGQLETFADLMVKANFPLYTAAVATSSEGERGLSRLERLYDRRKMGGEFLRIPGHDQLQNKVEKLVDSWLSDKASVVEYMSGYSGDRGDEMAVWAAWKNGQYTSSELRVAPGLYHAGLRQFFVGLFVFLLFAFVIYLWYRFKIWPFRESVRVVQCPEGCGRLIPEAWPVCKFCELKDVWGRMVLLNGDRAGQVWYLKHDHYVIGSGPEDDVILTHLRDYPVQAGHATLQWVEDGQKIVVRSDHGPVKVAGRKVDDGASAGLRFGDILEIGEGGIHTILLRGVESVG